MFLFLDDITVSLLLGYLLHDKKNVEHSQAVQIVELANSQGGL